ncbi:MAG: ADP-ribose diphosphatase [Methylomicrobium sp.]
MDKIFEILDKQELYHGFFRLEKYRLKHSLYAGGWSPEIERELFRRGSCVAVVLYDPDQDSVVLIEQFRVGALLRQEQPWLLEIVAGAVEEGETPEEVAYREALEEAGCEIRRLVPINAFYTTPGGASEWLTLFCGIVDSTNVGGIHGLEHEQEDILVSVVSFDEAYAWVEQGKINSGIPIIAIQWLALNRDKLRHID